MKSISSICSYYIFLSIPWCGEGVWGGGGSVYFRHLYMCGWAGGGGLGLACGYLNQLLKLFFLYKIFGICSLFITLFHQIHEVGKGWGGGWGWVFFLIGSVGGGGGGGGGVWMWVTKTAF